MPDAHRLTKTRTALSVVATIASVAALIAAALVYYNLPSPPPPLTTADALRRAADDLQQVLDKAFDGPWRGYTVEKRPDEKRGFCRAANGFVTDQKIVTVTTALHGIDAERLDDYMLILSAWLPEYGWNLSTRLYEPRHRYYINVARDGYIINARTDENGVIVLSNSSPCADTT